MKHNKVLHERVVFLATITQEVPSVQPEERAVVESLGNGFWQVKLRYGFMEDADVPAALRALGHPEPEFRPMETTYFLGHGTLDRHQAAGDGALAGALFAGMARNARPATTLFRLPPNGVVELGAPVEL